MSDWATIGLAIHFIDTGGYCVQTSMISHASKTADAILDELTMASREIGRTAVAIDQDHVCKERMPSAAELAAAAKADRLNALRAKGWANLSDEEKEEANALKFDLGL